MNSMSFRSYPKIHRLGKEEVEGILEGECVIQEKVDGANVSIWLENGELCMGSRTRKLGEEEFDGFVPYVRAHDGIKKLFTDHPNYRLYGEWLVRHTIQYNELSYRQFYLFDVTERALEGEDENYIPQWAVEQLAKEYGIAYPQVFCTFVNPKLEDIMPYVGKTVLGEKGEGVVIKNLTFYDKFGNQNYAKIVTQEFKEENGITFGGNNKHSDTYWEMYIVNKYMTLARIEKIMHKTQPQVDKKLDFEHTSRIVNTAYHDMLTEEIWEIAKKVGTVDFKALSRLSQKKAAQIYKDVLNGSISVADKV